MEEQTEIFRLMANEKLVEDNVPLDSIEKVLRRYGANQNNTKNRLIDGHRVRVLGQNLRLERWNVHSDGKATQTALHAAATTQPAQMPPTPFQPVLQGLSTRADGFRRRSLIFGGAALSMAIVGGGLYALGMSAGPTASIDQIVVPGVIENAFQAGGYPNNINGSLLEAESFITTLVDHPVFRAITGLGMMMGIALGVLRGNFSMLVPAIFVGLAPLFVSMVLGSMAVPDSDNVRSGFDSALASKDLPAMERLLSGQDQIDQAAKAYVLAQASVASGETSKWVVLTANNIQQGKLVEKYSVPAEIAFAIEARAVGSQSPSLSAAAKQYRDGAIAKAESFKINSFWALTVAGLLALMATGYGAISQIISNRVRRIGELLHL
jgi:hypothetical protein